MYRMCPLNMHMTFDPKTLRRIHDCGPMQGRADNEWVSKTVVTQQRLVLQCS